MTETETEIEMDNTGLEKGKQREIKERDKGTQLGGFSKQGFGWAHIKAILIAGIGFYCDAYDLFIINLVVPMLGYVYYDDHKVPAGDQTLLKGAAVVGTFFGQLIFGILGDVLGRRSVYVMSILLMVVGALVSAMSSSAERGMSAIAMLCIWRLVLGVGIGGDYPLSAVITSEYSTAKTRGRMMAAVFSMQGIGQLSAALVAIIVIRSFKGAIEEDYMNVDYVWRICLGLGCVPAVIGAYFRFKMDETPQFKAHVLAPQHMRERREDRREKGREEVQADEIENSSNDVEIQIQPDVTGYNTTTGKARWTDFVVHYRKWEHFKVLFGCAMAWFFLDVAFYGLGLNQSIVLESIGFTKKGSVYEDLFSVAYGNGIINLMGSVPGYWATVALVEKMGRIKIQVMGFGVLTVIFIVLSAGYNSITQEAVPLFIFLYCVGQFFFNFGPNTTTFIIPGEVFPTRFRSTSHGISAATGKLGAMVSSFGFTYMVSHDDPAPGVQKLLAIFSVFTFLGLITTFLIPETKGRTLEEINDEDENEKTDVAGPSSS